MQSYIEPAEVKQFQILIEEPKRSQMERIVAIEEDYDFLISSHEINLSLKFDKSKLIVLHFITSYYVDRIKLEIKDLPKNQVELKEEEQKRLNNLTKRVERLESEIKRHLPERENKIKDLAIVILGDGPMSWVSAFTFLENLWCRSFNIIINASQHIYFPWRKGYNDPRNLDHTK